MQNPPPFCVMQSGGDLYEYRVFIVSPRHGEIPKNCRGVLAGCGTVFNDLFAFILDTAKADHELQWNICHSCILADVNHGPGAIQEKTGFLYLGELLERYEERFGMPEADLRAIALALALTRDLQIGRAHV